MSRATYGLLCRCLVTLSLACALAIPQRSNSSSHLSNDPDIVAARQLHTGGQHKQALQILRSIDADHPDRVEVLFLTGLSAIGAALHPGVGDQAKDALLTEAVLALHEILVKRPELLRVRLELARALFLKGEDELAREHFEVVLAVDPPAPIVANVQRFLDLIDGRRSWRGRFGMNIVRDDNLNATSSSDVIYFFNLPFRRSADEGIKSSTGVRTNIGATKWLAAGDGMRIVIDGDVFHTEHEGSDLDQSTLAASAGPVFDVGENGELDVRANVVQRFSAGRRHSSDLGARLSHTERLTDRTSARGSVSWTKRDYVSGSRHDGKFVTSSLTASTILSGVSRANLSAGYDRERPMDEMFRTSTRWAGVGYERAFPGGFLLGVNVRRRWTRFGGSWFPYTAVGEQRRDRTTSFELSATNRSLVVFGLSPKVTVGRELRDSRAQQGDYKRTTFGVEMVRQF